MGKIIIMLIQKYIFENQELLKTKYQFNQGFFFVYLQEKNVQIFSKRDLEMAIIKPQKILKDYLFLYFLFLDRHGRRPPLQIRYKRSISRRKAQPSTTRHCYTSVHRRILIFAFSWRRWTFSDLRDSILRTSWCFESVIVFFHTFFICSLPFPTSFQHEFIV